MSHGRNNVWFNHEYCREILEKILLIVDIPEKIFVNLITYLMLLQKAFQTNLNDLGKCYGLKAVNENAAEIFSKCLLKYTQTGLI